LGAFFPTNNFAVPRKSFLELGGFDPQLRYGGDRDFCYRWASRGYRFLYAPEAVIRHAHGLSLASFLKLHFRYGGGTHRFRSGCNRKGLPPVKISPLSWYAHLVLSGLRSGRGPSGIALTALLGASQAASAAGMLCSCLQESWRKNRNGGFLYNVLSKLDRKINR
jgi:hypothetical protein